MFESLFDARGNWIRLPVAPDRDVGSREAREAIQEYKSAVSPRAYETARVPRRKGLEPVAMMTCREVSTLVSTGDLFEARLARRLGVRPRTCETRIVERLVA